MIARARKGPLARFLAGLDAKTVALLVAGLAGLGGVRWESGQRVEQAEEKAARVERSAARTGGRLRAVVDSLGLALERERDERRREVRALRRELGRLRESRPAAAPERLERPEPSPEPEPDWESEENLIGPPEPEDAPARAPSPVRRLWRFLGAPLRALGGG